MKREGPEEKSKIAQHAIKWAAILGLLFFACAKNRDFMLDAMRCVKDTTPACIGIIFLLGNAYIVLAGLINSIMTRTGDVHVPAAGGIYCEYMCAFYRLATLGSGGGIAQVYYYHTKGIPASRGLGMAVCQYTCHKIAIGIYGVIGFLVMLFMEPRLVSAYRWFLLAGIFVIAAICAFLFVIMVSKKFSDVTFRIGYKLVGKKKGLAKKLASARRSVKSMQDQSRRIWSRKGMFGKLLVINLVKQTCWYLIPGVILSESVGEDIFVSMFLMAVVNMLGCVMVAPSGIGTLEFCFALLFGKIIGKAEVIAATLILYRAFTWLVPFLLGLPCALFFKKPTNGDSQSASRSV